MVGGGGAAKLKRAFRKMVEKACGSFNLTQEAPHHVDPLVLLPSISLGSTNKNSEIAAAPAANSSAINTPASTAKSMCAICLDPLCYSTSGNPGQAIFTAQCSHSFHFACISSNVRHGSVTCPICRAHWTQLPRNLNAICSVQCSQTDPILQILDDSIANFRVHRRSFLRSAHYNDDDPIEPDHTPNHPRLRLALLPVSVSQTCFCLCSRQTSEPNYCHLCLVSSQQHSPNSSSALLFGSKVAAVHHPITDRQNSSMIAVTTKALLCVSLAHQPATDLVLVASPNGPHLRLMKQSMALLVFSLRPIDRLAIVTYSSTATRIFPLRRMTSYGKRAALQVIDRLFFMGLADPIEGLKKGVKILEDRMHRNPLSSILHLSDSPTRSYHGFSMEVPTPIHRFHIGLGFSSSSNGLVMQEFEEFLARVLGGAIREIQLKIGEGPENILMLGELRGGEEKRIPLDLGESGHAYVEYSYIEGGGVDECIRTGEIVVSVGNKGVRSEEGINSIVNVGGRNSSVESWDYHDPFMARRWAKHLHGYRL